MPATRFTPDKGPLLRSLSATGATVALAMSWVALSPSLLPRSWWASGLTVAVSSIFGYAVGTLLQTAWIALTRASTLRVSIDPVWGRWLRRSWFALLVATTLWSWVANVHRQDRLEALVGVPSAGWAGQTGGLLLGAVLFAVLLGVARGVRKLASWLSHRFAVVLPGWLAPISSLVVVGLLVVAVTNGVVVRPLLETIIEWSATANRTPWDNRVPPIEPTRSGSPASWERWDTLGAQGQAVVADGPRAADIEAVTHRPAIEPIRAYAAIGDDRDIEATARAVVAELDRTDAWQRSYLLVATAVGEGWVEEYSLSSLEYLTGGDCASASMQYSFLPSGLAYVIDRESPARAGRALWQAVHQRWSQLPPDDRPELLVSGESLGSYGSQAAFDSPEQLLTEADAAVWVGTPNFTPLWSHLTENRRPGSPEVAPVIDNGRHIRFITTPAELAHDHYGGTYLPWQDPRVVYVQHASDPVVWWSVDLLWREPDWARERAGHDVDASMRWRPWVTFWQLMLDMPGALDPDAGHAHSYRSVLVPVWNAVLGQPADADEVARIQQAISASIVPR
ncbi:MAG: alpha/beta hydrolase [Brooklawnia sp.]|uniref:alpha/beta hydrolase n=1 Tax=Brooklawnia sp. TaxID=2699740 RepID=UPI003C725791